MEFSRQENWDRLPFPTPGDLSDSGIEPRSSVSPALQVVLYPLSHLGSLRLNEWARIKVAKVIELNYFKSNSPATESISSRNLLEMENFRTKNKYEKKIHSNVQVDSYAHCILRSSSFMKNS